MSIGKGAVLEGTDLEKRIQRLEDIHEICNLQGRYNHYVLAHQYDKIVDMFAKKDPKVRMELADSGPIEGLEGVREVFNLVKTKYVFAGGLGLHMLMTPVVEVGSDGQTARGMWHSFGCNTIQTEEGLIAMWQSGKYDNEFVKEDGEWKSRVFTWHVHFRTPYDKGWVEQPIIGSLRPDSKPGDSEFYQPYDPEKINPFLPLPPEPMK